ncbi:MAG TPA: HPP family protein [Terriglobia bacterium]|nr:HPP family protein [Terriglobia bacterium]
MPRTRNLMAATMGEALLILIVAAIGRATGMPLIFASLGPTAYELLEQPHSKSARTYNIVVGHLVGLGAGFFALWVFNAWGSPKVLSAGFVPGIRIWATVLAGALTSGITLAIDANQPASLATSLLVSLGSMQTVRSAVAIIIGVLILAGVGEPVRRQRAKYRPEVKVLPQK